MGGDEYQGGDDGGLWFRTNVGSLIKKKEKRIDRQIFRS